MPFSSLTDPVELARAQAALGAAWDEIRPTISAAQDPARERDRLAYIVAGLVAITVDEAHLTRRAVEKFKQSRS